jgi:hypothetical protein
MDKEKIFNYVVSYLFAFFLGISSFKLINAEVTTVYLWSNWILDLVFTIFFIRLAVKQE